MRYTNRHFTYLLTYLLTVADVIMRTPNRGSGRDGEPQLRDPHITDFAHTFTTTNAHTDERINFRGVSRRKLRSALMSFNSKYRLSLTAGASDASQRKAISVAENTYIIKVSKCTYECNQRVCFVYTLSQRDEVNISNYSSVGVSSNTHRL